MPWTTFGFGVVAAGLAAPIADLAGLPRIGVLDQTWLRAVGLILTVVAAGATIAATAGHGRLLAHRRR